MSAAFADRRQQITSLISHARRSTDDGLGQLLEAYRRELSDLAEEFLGRQLRRRMGVSDLVQETLLSAGQQFHSFRGQTDSEFRNWLHEILHSRLIDGVRRHQGAERRRIGLEETTVTDGFSDSRPSPSEVVALQEESLLVVTAINDLSPDLRKILKLRYVEDLTFEQIAAETGLSTATVWRRWFEAIDKIRREVQGP